jgi:hypothetical protein
MAASIPQHEVDRLDRAIVARLQVDGRIANVDLADAVSLSPLACLRRVKALETGSKRLRTAESSRATTPKWTAPKQDLA